METTKTSYFTCQSKSFISVFFTCQISACELQPFSCHDLANEIHSQTAKTVFSHLKGTKKGDFKTVAEAFGFKQEDIWELEKELQTSGSGSPSRQLLEALETRLPN